MPLSRLIILFFTLFIGLMSAVTACFVPEDIQLTAEEKTAMIDSLARERIEAVIPEVEAHCKDNFHRYVARATDSLINVYLDSTQYLNSTVE